MCGELLKMQVRLFLCPRDVGNPELASRWSCVNIDRAENLVDSLIAREVGDNRGSCSIPCYRDRGSHSVKSIGPVAHDVNHRRTGLRNSFLHRSSFSYFVQLP
jgi:hypothetical protein